MFRRVTLVMQIRPMRLRTRPSVSELTKVEPSGNTFLRVLFRENFQMRTKFKMSASVTPPRSRAARAASFARLRLRAMAREMGEGD